MKRQVLLGVVILALVAAAAVKLLFFPSIKEAYFAMDERSLRQAPAGLILVRPTHFAYLRQKGVLRAVAPKSHGDAQWAMGRNVPLRDVIAVAYDRNWSRVVLPADVPEIRYDFLFTAPAKRLPRFQEIVRRQLGYVAEIQTNNTDVLALKIANPALPGLKLSNDNEKRSVHYRDEKLHFTHMPIIVIINGFGRSLELPVVDKTGLTNAYDFSFVWNDEAIRLMQDEKTARGVLSKIVGGLGLKLEPDTAPQAMLVVKKAD